ncbi:MAG: hypothetical protein U0798_01685 [Gemmataceae bacterium]
MIRMILVVGMGVFFSFAAGCGGDAKNDLKTVDKNTPKPQLTGSGSAGLKKDSKKLDDSPNAK